jgi:hypothetical protein
MTDFSKAVIYNIYCKDITVLEFYIGSTHDEKKRKRDHKSNCNNENCERHYNLKVYKHIRDNGGWDNWIFKVIEEFPCENKIELVIREQYHYDLLNPALNTNRPYVSEEERKECNAKYYQDNIDEIKQKRANYRENNIEEIKEYDRIRNAKHYQDNIDEIKQKSKKYRENNIEKIKERSAIYDANYYEKNRDDILKRGNQKYKCECGKEYTHSHRARHFDTNIHKTYLENLLLN